MSSGNGALDYDKECVISGGNIIIYGSNGMWQNPSSNSTQYSLTFQYSGNSGDEVKLLDDSENEVVSFKSEKAYGCITISNSFSTNDNTSCWEIRSLYFSHQIFICHIIFLYKPYHSIYNLS